MQFFVYFTISDVNPMNPPSPEGWADMGKLMTESFESGIIVATGQLPSTSTRIRLESGTASLSDGPFIESSEVIPGFTIIQVDTEKQAVEWTTKLSACMGGNEVRMAQISHTGVEHLL